MEHTSSLRPDTPKMVVLSGRPINLLEHLSSSDDVFVACRLSSGADCHVPLREIFKLFQKETVHGWTAEKEHAR